MFLKSARVKGKEYIRIVESYRDEENKVKHKTIANLGRVDKLINLYPFFDKLIEKYIGDKYTSIENINKDNSAKVLNYGYIIIKDMWDKYKLSEFFKRIIESKKYKIKFDLVKTIFSLVINRSLKSELSKLGYFNNKDMFIYLNEELKKQDLYKSLDYLSEIKEELEDYLLTQSLKLFKRDIKVALYDVTTLYFESKKEDEDEENQEERKKGLRQFGLSKDFKINDTQIVLSLLLDTNGMPITFDIYEGNKAETKTLLDSLDRLKNRFKLEKVTIIADRGLSSSLNLFEIKERGYEYIVAIKYKNNKELEEKVLDKSNYNQISYSSNKGYYGYKEFIANQTKNIKIYEGYSLYNDNYINNNNITIKTDKNSNKYFNKTITLTHKIISTYSDIRAHKDEQDRNRAIDKLNKKISSNSLKTKTNEKYLKRVINTNNDNNCQCDISYEIDLAKIDNAKQYDGFYTIASSDTSLDALTIIQRHKTIYDIENAFRELKNDLNIRPIYHWTYKRIKGHIIISFLSYFLLKNIQYRLSNNKKIINYLNNNDETLSLKKIVTSLNEINLLKTDINNQDYYLKIKHSTLTSKILDTLKIKSPKHILNNKELEDYFSNYKHSHNISEHN